VVIGIGFCLRDPILKLKPQMKLQKPNVLVWNPKGEHMYPALARFSE
jgi:hypothetical protein